MIFIELKDLLYKLINIDWYEILLGYRFIELYNFEGVSTKVILNQRGFWSIFEYDNFFPENRFRFAIADSQDDPQRSSQSIDGTYKRAWV